jgi:hypothetical protein
MTNIASKSLLSAFAVSAVAGLAMMATAGSAAAKKVQSCEGTDRRSVIECCEHIVARKGLPNWMIQTGRNCSSATVCKGGKQPLTHAVAPRLCRVVYVPPNKRDGGDSDSHNPPGGRNPNGGPVGAAGGNNKPF